MLRGIFQDRQSSGFDELVSQAAQLCSVGQSVAEAVLRIGVG
jgi:hypothetical protein